ncbi:MAG: thioredoxin family protein [Flavobacterium sp. MedPE-SWcel]|uniref:thioredoxin family protein n=1 Tax=uncultured Flavobacterium sp. TaxID=165435 RepID=UPI000917107D|nr:thioredoxin family protein [uncultured Flavobacterium sp.]OIQ18090.1 MAG: thioredoxin family protein [Flavobacterium sp. MedPE-SWcel]
MALTESSMMKLGTKAPNFNLLDTISGKIISLSELQSDIATVVVFICNHCPFVHHVNAKLVEVANHYQAKGVQFIAISSNSVETHPQDAPELMTVVAKNEGYSFPYLYDETQEIAKAYKAECTPDFFIFDNKLECAYRGRFDETRPNMGEPTGRDLSIALDSLLSGEKVDQNQYPSMGCNIKWK